MVGAVMECPNVHVIGQTTHGQNEEAMMQTGCGWAAWRRARQSYLRPDDTNQQQQSLKFHQSKSNMVRKTKREIWGDTASKYKMSVSTLFIVFVVMNLSMRVVLVSAVSASASFTQSCSYDVETKRLWCSLRTLNAQNNTSSMPSAARAEHITIQCSNVYFYESILKINHFGYLPHLNRLSIESCLVKKMPALAFSGLSGLQGLNFVNNVKQAKSDIEGKVILEIEPDAFTGLNDLRSLNFRFVLIFPHTESNF